jgi:hypothetical protein
VLDVLRRAEEDGAPRPELRADVQRPGAAVGLAIGLAFRQLALLHEDVTYSGWSAQLAA